MARLKSYGRCLRVGRCFKEDFGKLILPKLTGKAKHALRIELHPMYKTPNA